jgi:2-oxoglutarate ferredoxin oxidoreductase subunit beta
VSTAVSTPLTAKDFKTAQEVRWCPGCGDYSILNALQKTLAARGVRKESVVFVSGIGCSSRFPYYMDTYGIHSIHGRAPSVATGVKLGNPDLDVWVVTGDGDALSIGGNHFLHTIRRNIGLKIILFNNRIYGLTKGQASPTGEVGKKTKSTPFGSIADPMHAISVAIGANVTFAARAIYNDLKMLQTIFERAAEHRGVALIEIYQDCVVYNPDAFSYLTDRQTRDDHIIYLEHGKPLVFGKNRDKGLRLTCEGAEVVQLGGGVSEKDLLVHDEHCKSLVPAFVLSRLHYPEFPTPLGVFRDVPGRVYEDSVFGQVRQATEKFGPGTLEKLFNEGDVWTVA